MDDALKTCLLLIVFAWIPVTLASVEDPEFISQAQVNALIQQFNDAQSAVDKTLLTSKAKWSCNMYGVRSRLQVRRDLLNYHWALVDNQWENSGELPVSRYSQGKDGLHGTGDRGIRDEVRQLGKDRLISRLTRLDSPGLVLSYSVCTATP